MTTLKEVTNDVQAREIMPQVNRLYNSLQEFKVNSTGSWLEALEKIKMAKDRIRQIKKVEKEFLDPINELKDKTKAFFSPAIDKLTMIVETLEQRSSTWKNEQLERERIAREKAEAEAREKERAEKDKLRKEAEDRERAARLAQAEADEARKKAEELARRESFERSEKARIEAERLQVEASKLNFESKKIKQEAKEVYVAPKEVVSKVEKTEGLHFRRYWKARIVNANKIPREFLIPDTVAINEYVSKNKENASIPGVEVYFEDKTVG